MYVIYSTTREKDYGYGGWKDSYTNYFDIIGFTPDKEKAKQYVEEAEKKVKSSEEIYYDYESVGEI